MDRGACNPAPHNSLDGGKSVCATKCAIGFEFFPEFVVVGVGDVIVALCTN